MDESGVNDIHSRQDNGSDAETPAGKESGLAECKMKLDEAMLSAAQIPEMVRTDILHVHTWTTRGFADPYHAKPGVRRGRGKPRSYSLRAALRFFLMARLHDQYRTPLPRGLQICQAVFGEENFDPRTAAYVVLEESTSQILDLKWYRDPKAVARRLATEPVALVMNVNLIHKQICGQAQRLLQREAG